VPAQYTPLLGLVEPAIGQTNWGSTVNNSLTLLLDAAIAGYATADVTSGDWTLTTTGGGAANEQRMAILIATGTPAATRYLNAPKQSKTYVVMNNVTDGSNLYVRGGPTSPTTGVIIPAGSSALVAWDSNTNDFVKVAGGGGGATGGGNDTIFFENGQTVTTSYTIPTATNAGTYGPIAVNSGVVVTVPDDSTWTVV
jgi:hypothetical protein